MFLKIKSLREFLDQLEAIGQLKRITHPVDPYYEMTEISDRTLKLKGPALLFENPLGHNLPVVTNLFGTRERIAMGMGQPSVSGLKEVGNILSYLRAPEPPGSFKEVIRKIPVFSKIFNMPTKRISRAPCQEIILEGEDVDLSQIPVMTCWSGDVGPLLSWGLTVTKGPTKKRQNIGIYRQQKIGRNKVIMRWLSHRGGALDFKDWIEKKPGCRFPVSVAFGADPATTLAAVMPIPDTLSEYAFAGLLRGCKTEVVQSISNHLNVPANSEIILEGFIDPEELAEEGPYGDHTGYFNEVERHNVLTITHITMRNKAIYHSTYTGRPPDEPAILGVAMNEVLIPILKKQFPELVDFYLPPEGCSYRVAVIAIKKQYPGHARQVMMGAWSFLRQFMYTKYIIVCDEGVDPRDWESVAKAMTDNISPIADALFINKTPIDSLDFASPAVGLGSKMGLDATIKWEVEREKRVEPIPPPASFNINFLSQWRRHHPTVTDIKLPRFTGQRFIFIQMKKKKSGQSRELMGNLVTFLEKVGDIKFIAVFDEDINLSIWEDVIWAIATRTDPERDILRVDRGKKRSSILVFDATNKLPGEVQRKWGKPIKKDPEIIAKIDRIWDQLNIT